MSWGFPEFLEILLEISMSLQIHRSRNFPGNMQVLPEISLEICRSCRKLFSLQSFPGAAGQNFLVRTLKIRFLSAVEFKFLSDPHDLSQKFCTSEKKNFFFAFFSSRGREMRIFGGCLVEISRNISRKKVVLHGKFLDFFFGKV